MKDTMLGAITDNPVLSTIGVVMLGLAGGFLFELPKMSLTVKRGEGQPQ